MRKLTTIEKKKSAIADYDDIAKGYAEEFYKKSIIVKSNLKNNNICKTLLPIDSNNLYDKEFK